MTHTSLLFEHRRRVHARHIGALALPALRAPVPLLTTLVVGMTMLATTTALAASSLHRCASAPFTGRLMVSVDPGPGCDGAAILARRIHATAEHRFPRALPRHYSVTVPHPPADAKPATFRFDCVVSSAKIHSRRVEHLVRVTTARCANGAGSRFRYSFTMG